MTRVESRGVAAAALLLLVPACKGASGPSGESATVSAEPAGANCALGGVKVQIGASAPSYVCHGAAGASVAVAVELPGDRCPAGGVSVHSGSGAPVYVCHGAAGANAPAPTLTGEPSGVNCAEGGLAIQVGAGTPSYVCNGAPGAAGSDGLSVVVEDAGTACPNGGLSVHVGPAGTSSYVCNGVPGANGADGADGLPAIVSSAGPSCPYGGLAVQIGPGGTPSYVCSGAPGAPGADGFSVVIGDAGASCPAGGISVQVGPTGPISYVCSGLTPTITDELPGPNCPAGGARIQVGAGAPQYVCNGASVTLDPCVSKLYGPMTDPWGDTWDGSERGLATLPQAAAACTAIGGRLPLATELLRVSAVQAGGVGETYDTNYLWTLVPAAPTQQIILRMSDGSVTTSAVDAGTKRPYRCRCADVAPAGFDAEACSGPPGSSCTTLLGEGGRNAIDSADRAPLPVTSALWECAFSGAHLANTLQYLEAIPNGLPNGSGSWLHVADAVNPGGPVLVKWTGTQPAWAPAGNVSYASMTDLRPFRCAGPTAAPTPFPPPVADEFVGAINKGEQHDSAAAGWPVVLDACFARGGHLPRATELAELVHQGLPNGTAQWLWTSDAMGASGSQFLQGTIAWSGTEPRYQLAYPTGLSWQYKTGSFPFRCLYHPLDAGYAGPADASCQGGCVRLQVGSGPATMWFDRFDRVPAVLAAAAKTCAAAGGHLASERDYVEAIRSGLPNGSAAWLHSWDLTGSGTAIPYDMAVRWTGTEVAFNDQYPGSATWIDPAGASPYRCVWTNELR